MYRFLRILVLLVLLLPGCGSDSEPSAPPPTPTPTPESARYLFLLYSDAGELSVKDDGSYVFRMKDVWNTVVAFADRPFRDAISTPLQQWVDEWATNHFDQNPPNAAITMLVDGSVQITDWAIMTLRNPRFSNNDTLEFDATFLQLPNGHPAFFPTVLGSGVKPTFLTTQVFIDSAGTVTTLPDRLAWQVNGVTELTVNLNRAGYSANDNEVLNLYDPQERFCSAANARPTLKLDLAAADCENQNCTIAIDAAVSGTQLKVLRIPGVSRDLTADVTITTYENCDPTKPINLSLANALRFGSLGAEQSPTPTTTRPPGTPVATPTPSQCSLETELGISAANGWLPLSDAKCTNAGVADVGSTTCPKAYVDGTQAVTFGASGLNSVLVHGNGLLAIEDNFVNGSGDPVTLNLSRIEVGVTSGDPSGSAPQLIIGTKTCPIRKTNVSLSFYGDPAAPSSANYLRNKGIIIGTGGSLFLHGATGVVPQGTLINDANGTKSWTYLTTPAGPSKWSTLASGIAVPVPTSAPETTLQVAKAVDWRPGDWIVVASTDFAEDHQEIVQIASVSRDTSSDTATITLNPDTPLTFYHFGSAAPSRAAIPANTTSCNGVDLNGIDVSGLPGSFCDGPDRNYGVDERAEVGLLSRNVKLTGADSTADPHYGGQIRIEPGFNTVEIEGVELEKFGQAIATTDNQSAYPIHFHHSDSIPAGTVVNSNSVHHSYNKCVVVHDSNGLRAEHNVCARIVGHGFYLEVGNETGNVFYGNLVAGVMATSFTPQMPDQFWPADYLARGWGSNPGNGYDGTNVFTTSAVAPPVGRGEGPAPTAFWIANADNTFQHNSVSGCQLQGRGYWIMPQDNVGAHANFPANGFDSNRVHGCYGGIDSGADAGATSVGFTPQVSNKDLVAMLTNVTVTRVRNKGIWLRPGWYHVDGARVATTRDGISLVSAGGVEGSPPGEWALLSNSVLIGMSANNPERFGPCPSTVDGSCYGMQGAGGNGFPNPHWNSAGFMFYDGPARLETVRFVNFNVGLDRAMNGASYLTADDRAALKSYISINSGITPVYEGDAALGWFQSNVNNYPPTQYTEGLIWENTDFKHQVYTEEVNLATFVDGDKNTVILDRDGTLSGYQVVDAQGTPVAGRSPISLNNLEFNAIAPASGALSVDECHALGAQDVLAENRPTALMSPEAYATLESTAWDPSMPETASTPDQQISQLMKKNPLTFIKDQQDYTDYTGSSGFEPWSPHHYSMTLVGRNLTQVREPKVMRGASYTVHSFKQGIATGAYMGNPVIAPPHALPRFVSFSLTDVISGSTKRESPGGREVFEKPFRIRLGLCYKAQGGHVPASAASFQVDRGRVSLGGQIGDPNPDAFKRLTCNNFATNDPRNYNSNGDLDPTLIGQGCPYSPDGSSTRMTAYTDWDMFESNKDGYYYDAAKGMLFLYIEQDEPNAVGAAPIGTCTDQSMDDACKEGRDFYSCPLNGCMLYTVRVVDSNYLPLTTPYGPTMCDDVYEGDTNSGTTNRDYTDTYPPNGTVNWEMDRLAYAGTTTLAEITTVSTNEVQKSGVTQNFPHAKATDESKLSCPVNFTGPLNPTVPAVQGAYFIAPAGGTPPYVLSSVTFTDQGGQSTNATAGTPNYSAQLDLGHTFTMTVNATLGGVAKQCTMTIQTTGTEMAPLWTATIPNACNTGPGNVNNTIGLGPF